MYHFVISKGLPKKILLVVVPLYIIMAWSSYAAFKKKVAN